MPTDPTESDSDSDSANGTETDESTATDDDLTDRQRHLVATLPATSAELAEELGITNSTVHDHISAVRECGVPVEADYPADGGPPVYYLEDAPQTRRVATKHTGTKTREANQWATEMEAAILRRLKHKDPLVATQDPTPSNEDFVVHLTDVHMGDVVETADGREVFNPEICEQSVEHFTQKALNLKRRMEAVTDFDTCHLLWGGDMLTNENIYDGQAFDISLMLGDQMARAVDAMTQQAKTFADAFDTLQIVAQPGNHGKTRASGVSKQANMDLLAYRWVEDRLIEAGYDNIQFVQSEAQHFRNFELRGGHHRGHLRHGQNAQTHVDATAASARDWRGWLVHHGFDIAWRGHYHEARREDVLNEFPVIESPSMKPGAEFAEKIGQPDVATARKLGTVHGVSDDRPVTWEYTVDALDLDRDLGLVPAAA